MIDRNSGTHINLECAVTVGYCFRGLSQSPRGLLLSLGGNDLDDKNEEEINFSLCFEYLTNIYSYALDEKDIVKYEIEMKRFIIFLDMNM